MPTAEDFAKSAQSTAQTAINSFDPSATSQKQLGQYQGLWGNQQGQTNDYLKQYTDTIKANPSVQQLYQQGNQNYNVEGLGKTANYLQNQVANAIPTQYQSARGSDIGNTQIQNAVAQKLQYLQPQSSAATNNFQTAQGLSQGYVNAGLQQNQFNLLPVQEQGRMLTDSFSRQQSGYSQALQAEFDGLKQKLQSGIALSQEEYNRANQLSSLENAFKIAQTQAQNAQDVARLNQQYQTIPAGQTLFNTFTNQIAKAR